MATFCYKCKSCGTRFNGTTPGTAGEMDLPCVVCGGAITRDYKAEGVGVNVAMLRDTRDGTSAYDRVFLPDNKDFAGPKDPDGTKGMREWRDTHQPRDTNHAPRWPGTVEKKVM
jgi:hypothetical protein